MDLIKYKLFGTQFCNITLEGLNDFFTNRKWKSSGYICLPNSFVITLTDTSTQLQEILNNSTMTLPDGKPLEWLARFRGNRGVKTISGYWLMQSLLKTDLKHFFYGVTEEKLEKLREKIENEYPDAKVMGYQSPPFCTEGEISTNAQIKEDIAKIKTLSPDLIWVGISSPKQDILMSSHYNEFNNTMMLGVGAVFDYMIGTEKKSPEWIKKIGMRWVYRIYQDPKKHLRKYLISNTRFLQLVFKGF